MNETVKVYVLGTAEDIAKALAAVLDDRWNIERLYPRIAESLAGRELVAPGIALAYQLALYDAVKAEEVPMQMITILGMWQDKFLEAIKATSVWAQPEPKTPDER